MPCTQSPTSSNILLYSSFHDQSLRLSTFSIKFKTSLEAAFQPEAPFQLQIHHNSLHTYFKDLSSAFQLLFPFNTGAQFYVFLKRSYFATPYVWPLQKITLVIIALCRFLCRNLSIGNFLQISLSLGLFVLEKHCQRHNGPEGWVLVTKVTSLGHITSSQTNLDKISFIFIISSKQQLQNLNQILAFLLN